MYTPGTSVVHTADSLSKIVVLFVYSITLFFVQTWTGLGLCALACISVLLTARVALGRMMLLLVPVSFILLLTLLFNSFSLDVFNPAQTYGLGNVSAGIFTGCPAIALVGNFGFMPEGFARGLFYVLRIALLAVASFTVCMTTSANDLADALNDLLSPLRKLGVPTQDLAMMASIALRFIPVTAEELLRLRAAQLARGAGLEDKGLIRSLLAWQTVLIPLFVGLFRRADNLAVAMETRCYGMGKVQTKLRPRDMGGATLVATAAAVLACIAVGYCL